MKRTPKELLASGWVPGLDVSDNQSKPIDWRKLYAEGYRYVWVKLTEGETFSSVKGVEFAYAAQQEGFLVSGYHYARPDNDTDNASPIREARNFIAELYAAGETVVNGLPPVLDYEEPIVKGGNARQWVADFLGEVKHRTGLDPWYYSSVGTYLHLAPEGTGLWGAAYTDALDTRDLSCWQYTGNGRTKGYPGKLDLNLMDPQAWAKLTRKAGI